MKRNTSQQESVIKSKQQFVIKEKQNHKKWLLYFDATL